MKKITFCLVLLILFAVACKSSEQLETVEVGSGLIKGTFENGVSVYKGIPYAAPPVGELRWCPPAPPLTWEGVRMADEFAANPVQHMVKEYGPWTAEYQPQREISEDCLYLNIWTTAKTTKEKRPVMVYIPGGAFTGGSGNVPVYNGENLAKKGVVIVTINYRVEVIGFLAHPELTKESENHSSGNYGLLDQLAALKWVKNNILAFGGDPNTITIMGQSAGAASVHALLKSPLAKGLFKRAIAMSGSSARTGASHSLSHAEDNGLKFAEAAKAVTLADLRKMSSDELIQLSRNKFSFGPIADGWYIPAEENDFLSDVTTLTGFVADEGSYMDDYGKVPAEKYKIQVMEQAGMLTEKYLDLYPASTDEQSSKSQKLLRRDLSMISMNIWAKEREKYSDSELYTYLFDHPQPGKTKEKYLTFHSSEIPYVFNNLNYSPRPWKEEDKKIAEMMSDYWINFISTGDPNGEELPKWSTFKSLPNETMILGDKMEHAQFTSKEKFELLKMRWHK